ncbi:MAG: histidine kinase [Ruthenibacterium sp.]
MKRIPITKKLFYTYTALFLVFYVCVVSVAVTFMTVDINRNIISTQKQMAQAISRSVEQYFEEMNTFSLSLMNSQEFKQAVIYDLPQTLQNGENQQEALQRVYSSAYKMFGKGYYVGVATRDNVYVWMADRILVEKVPVAVTTYDGYSSYGAPVLKLLADNEYLKALDAKQGRRHQADPAVCLARSINISNRFSHPQAMLEVQVKQSDFARFMQQLTDSTNTSGLRMSVFNAQGDTLYGSGRFPSDKISSTEWKAENGYMSQMHALFGGAVHVLYEIPTHNYYKKLTQFLACAVAFSVALCALMLLVTYRISKQISKPISKMCVQLEQINLAESFVFSKVETEIYELDLLAQTVASLNEKLIASLNHIVTLRTAELQSRLMALQSQMQPHFLYNTLTVIGTLSEQGAQKQVTRMCGSLSQMLRYVGSQQEKGVCLFEEVRFLRSYMDIMKERFLDAALVLEIPMDMMHITVPKLVLQPLAENAFKYGDISAPTITIKGWCTADEWHVTVRDSGKGFSKEKAQETMQRCYDMAKNATALSAHVDGMGLVNIYARLFLFYGEAMTFHIVPGPNGGVEIGGVVNVQP